MATLCRSIRVQQYFYRATRTKPSSWHLKAVGHLSLIQNYYGCSIEAELWWSNNQRVGATFTRNGAHKYAHLNFDGSEGLHKQSDIFSNSEPHWGLDSFGTEMVFEYLGSICAPSMPICNLITIFAVNAVWTHAVTSCLWYANIYFSFP